MHTALTPEFPANIRKTIKEMGRIDVLQNYTKTGRLKKNPKVIMDVCPTCCLVMPRVGRCLDCED